MKFSFHAKRRQKKRERDYCTQKENDDDNTDEIRFPMILFMNRADKI